MFDFFKVLWPVIKKDFIAILIGIIILVFWGTEAFLIYLLIIILLVGEVIFERFKSPNYLQIKNDRLIKMIIRHLKINDDEWKRTLKEAQTDMTVENYDLFKEEINQI